MLQFTPTGEYLSLFSWLLWVILTLLVRFSFSSTWTHTASIQLFFLPSAGAERRHILCRKIFFPDGLNQRPTNLISVMPSLTPGTKSLSRELVRPIHLPRAAPFVGDHLMSRSGRHPGAVCFLTNTSTLVDATAYV